MSALYHAIGISAKYHLSLFYVEPKFLIGVKLCAYTYATLASGYVPRKKKQRKSKKIKVDVYNSPIKLDVMKGYPSGVSPRRQARVAYAVFLIIFPSSTFFPAGRVEITSH